jgi:hypothetical protein
MPIGDIQGDISAIREALDSDAMRPSIGNSEYDPPLRGFEHNSASDRANSKALENFYASAGRSVDPHRNQGPEASVGEANSLDFRRP